MAFSEKDYLNRMKNSYLQELIHTYPKLDPLRLEVNAERYKLGIERLVHYYREGQVNHFTEEFSIQYGKYSDRIVQALTIILPESSDLVFSLKTEEQETRFNNQLSKISDLSQMLKDKQTDTSIYV